MARTGDTYSRLIALLKVLLPLIALAVLATLFLFDRGRRSDGNIPFATVDLDALAREQRLGKPSYFAVTKDGSQISFRAEAVRPDATEPDVFNSTRLRAEMIAPDGAFVMITANDGVIDGPSEIAELAGEVRIEMSQGYEVTTDRVAALLDTSRIEAPGAVVGSGPAGDFRAGNMLITRAEDSDSYVVVFNGGVKLVYRPGN